MACVNCKGHQFAYSRECPRWKVEKQVQQVKVEKHLSFYEARTLVETSTPVAASKLYAAAVKVFTTSIATQTDLTWPNAEDKFKKISDMEKAVKKAAKAAKNQEAKSTQVSLDSRNPWNDLTGKPGPSKSKTGKDTKNQKKDRLKKIERNIIPEYNMSFESLVNMDDKMDTTHNHSQIRKSPKKKINPILPPDD